jgi:hypothetical protein
MSGMNGKLTMNVAEGTAKPTKVINKYRYEMTLILKKYGVALEDVTVTKVRKAENEYSFRFWLNPLQAEKSFEPDNETIQKIKDEFQAELTNNGDFKDIIMLRQVVF